MEIVIFITLFSSSAIHSDGTVIHLFARAESVEMSNFRDCARLKFLARNFAVLMGKLADSYKKKLKTVILEGTRETPARRLHATAARIRMTKTLHRISHPREANPIITVSTETADVFAD